MVRHSRQDEAGAWHHVMNRGIARRVVFEDTRERRAFLALLACQVRAGAIELHAFCLLSTHYHLLVRSPKGALSAVMQRVGNGYVRWFNRRHRRDGSLFRGRFLSKPVRDHPYRRQLVRYIDENPVRAGLCRRPGEYPHGSAHAWATGRLPRWLSSSWILQELGHDGPGPLATRAYDAAFGTPLNESQRERIERAQVSPPVTEEDVQLFRSTPDDMRRWMIRKARLADGTGLGAPLLDTATITRTVARCIALADDIPRVGLLARAAPHDVIRVALLRELGGLSLRGIARLVGVSQSTVQRHYATHREESLRNGRYTAAVTAIARDVLCQVQIHPIG